MQTPVVIKIGPWGGDGGSAFDVTDPPIRLEGMTIRASSYIDSIGFSYVDVARQKRTAGPFGGTGGQPTTIQFAPGEYVKNFSGIIGLRPLSSGRKPVVESLEIETNIKKYGPYGKALQKDSSFSIPLQPQEDVSVTGFFGLIADEKVIYAIGVYIGYTPASGKKLDAIIVANDEETSGS
ncbi:unnamed protein product [Urochloa humidicola]